MLDALQKNNKIIVNTDLDGIFSAMILHHYLNCEIAGFCNSVDTVWIDKNKINAIDNAVYIDMFVVQNDVVCIDQHIIAVDEEHSRKIRSLGTKFNPNLDNPRFHKPPNSYYLKYPFGTVHYIIANLEKNAINLDLQLDNAVQPDLSFMDLLLRADDTMKTTVNSNYIQNAQNWWTWLINYSNKGKTVLSMYNYLDSLTGTDVACKKSDTTKLLTGAYHCDSPDGGFKNICDMTGSLHVKVKNYIRFLANASKLNVFDLNMKLEAKVGKANRISLNARQMEVIRNMTSKVFSYAFVRSPERSQHFSYTVMN